MKLHNVIGGLKEKKNTLVGSPGLNFKNIVKSLMHTTNSAIER